MTDASIPSNNSSRRWRLLMVLLAAAVIPWATSILYRYSPAEHDFYPRCVFHWLTGWHCPGCGATRCLYSLLHGDLAQALAYNPLFLIASPFLIYGGLRLGYEMATGKKAPGKIHTPTWTMPVVLAILLAFWIARNIDAFPFSVLAPHVL